MRTPDRGERRDRLSDLERTRRSGRRGESAWMALFWIALLTALFAAVYWWSERREDAAVAPPPRTPPPSDRARADATSGAAPAPGLPPAAVATPAPAKSPPIYRCGRTYGTVPCAGGRVVAEPAASGFDSRPSEQLSRLVARGPLDDGGRIERHDGRRGRDRRGRVERRVCVARGRDRDDRPGRAAAAVGRRTGRAAGPAKARAGRAGAAALLTCEIRRGLPICSTPGARTTV